uniref:Uncharacterized protein n=1 Tax=Oryza meridionalis TaxID=40149 RepID=A0A0E0DT61_9ORYZ
MEQQLTDLAAAMATIQTQNTTIQSALGSLAEIKPMVVELTGWKPVVDKAVVDLHEEVGKLRTQVQQVTRNPALQSKLANLSPLLPTPSGEKKVEIREEEFCRNGESDHREYTNFRGKAIGEDSSSLSLPGKGAYNSPSSNSPFSAPSRFEFGENSGRELSHHVHGNTARVDCPQFDGEGPRAWKLKGETYFRVCGLHPEVWVSVASLQFLGSALLWLQSTNAHVSCGEWGDFAEAICAVH